MGRYRAGFGEENRNQMVEKSSCGQAKNINIYPEDEQEGDGERMREIFTLSVT